jgi:NAD(P)H dehydrogenase (quinone)
MKKNRDLPRVDRRELLSGLTLAAITAALPGGRALAQAGEKIVVSGASGNLGGLTVKALLARGVPARNLILVSRTPDEQKEYAAMGASVRFGDFTQPESLPAAYAGGTRMLLISVGGDATTPAAVLLKRGIDAAKDAGVKHIAYTSYVGITKGDVAGRAADHKQAEDALKASGVAWTMLRNSIYMDGLLRQGAAMVASGKVETPPNEFPIGYITRADCGAAAAAVLSTPGHEGKAYDVTGPELLGVKEVAAAASAVTGKPIEVLPTAATTRPGFGREAMAFTTTHFKDLTGREPTNVRAFFESSKNALLGVK